MTTVQLPQLPPDELKQRDLGGDRELARAKIVAKLRKRAGLVDQVCATPMDLRKYFRNEVPEMPTKKATC